jgi:N-methylhydantoinase A
MPGRATEIFTLRVHAAVSQTVPALASVPKREGNLAPAIKRKRRATFGRERVEALVYEPEALRAGDRILGPAIIEERTTTVVVPPGFTCEVDNWRNYILRRG